MERGDLIKIVKKRAGPVILSTATTAALMWGGDHKEQYVTYDYPTFVDPEYYHPIQREKLENVRLLALGDSITKFGGDGPEGQQNPDGWFSKYEAYLNLEDDEALNLGLNRLTSFGLLKLLRDDKRYREGVKSADIITLGIGTNDYAIIKGIYLEKDKFCQDNPNCLQETEDKIEQNITDIVLELKSLNPEAPIIVLGLYHPFLTIDEKEGTLEPLWPYWVKTSNHIERVAAENGLIFVSLSQAFTGVSSREDQGLTLDGAHPNTAGNAAIAAKIIEAAGNISLHNK